MPACSRGPISLASRKARNCGARMHNNARTSPDTTHGDHRFSIRSLAAVQFRERAMIEIPSAAHSLAAALPFHVIDAPEIAKIPGEARSVPRNILGFLTPWWSSLIVL